MRTCILFCSAISATRREKFLFHLFCDFLVQTFGDHDGVALHINHDWTFFIRPPVSSRQGRKNISILHSPCAVLVCPTVAFPSSPSMDCMKPTRRRRPRPSG